MCIQNLTNLMAELIFHVPHHKTWDKKFYEERNALIVYINNVSPQTSSSSISISLPSKPHIGNFSVILSSTMTQLDHIYLSIMAKIIQIYL